MPFRARACSNYVGVTTAHDKPTISSFRDLLVWQRALELADACHALTQTLQRGRMPALRDQIERCCVSVPANIAEGNGRQRIGDYLRYLSIAGGSLSELRTHIELVARFGLASEAAVARPRALAEEVSRMLSALIKALEAHRQT
jgi:four helix bundle protein